jgi:hypothetical protein
MMLKRVNLGVLFTYPLTLAQNPDHLYSRSKPWPKSALKTTFFSEKSGYIT